MQINQEWTVLNDLSESSQWFGAGFSLPQQSCGVPFIDAENKQNNIHADPLMVDHSIAVVVKGKVEALLRVIAEEQSNTKEY